MAKKVDHSKPCLYDFDSEIQGLLRCNPHGHSIYPLRCREHPLDPACNMLLNLLRSKMLTGSALAAAEAMKNEPDESWLESI